MNTNNSKFSKVLPCRRWSRRIRRDRRQPELGHADARVDLAPRQADSRPTAAGLPRGGRVLHGRYDQRADLDQHGRDGRPKGDHVRPKGPGPARSGSAMSARGYMLEHPKHPTVLASVASSENPFGVSRAVDSSGNQQGRRASYAKREPSEATRRAPSTKKGEDMVRSSQRCEVAGGTETTCPSTSVECNNKTCLTGFILGTYSRA